MVEVVMQRRGMVNDFIGDGLLAVFGAPVDDAEHAWHAVSAASAMQDALAGLNARWRSRGGVALAIGVAVNTGDVFAGNLGASRVVAGLALPAVAPAQPRETVGVITEIKAGDGAVEVRAAGGPWRPAAPLQALRGGDEVRVTQRATAVVLLSGGRGIVKIDA